MKKKKLKKYLVTCIMESTEEIEVEAENEEDAYQKASNSHPMDWQQNCDGSIVDKKIKELVYMMNRARSNKPVNRGARTVVICNTVPLDSWGMAYTIRVPCVINEQSI